MRVLVTGGAGYIGSVVSEQLVSDGHEVVIYDNLSKGHRGAVVEGARFVQGDLLEADQLRQTLKHNRIEAVIHMAASSLVGESVAAAGEVLPQQRCRGTGVARCDARVWDNADCFFFNRGNVR